MPATKPPSKSKGLPSRVYAFGCRIDTEDEPTVLAQIRAAHAYRNKLVELERDRRRKELDYFVATVPALRLIHEERQRLIDQIQVEGLAEEEKKPLRSAIKECWKAFKRVRNPLYAEPDVAAVVDQFRSEMIAAGKEARAATKTADAYGAPISWGTYLKIEQARKQDAKGSPPKFRSFDGEGQTGVQLQKANQIHIPDLFAGTSTQLQIDPEGALLWGDGPGPWHRGRVRIGTIPGTQRPVWANFTVKLHRPLPTDGRISWAMLYAKRTGRRTKWELQLTIAREAWGYPDQRQDGGAIAINTGWRGMQDGSVRMATWVDDDGQQGHLELPTNKTYLIDKAIELQAIRDQRLNATLADLRTWRDTHRDVVATEWNERLGHVRSQNGLLRLIALWREHRMPGDDAIFTVAEQWVRREDHLYVWQSHLQRRWKNWRRDLYRNFAADMSRRYRTVVLADTDWRDFQVEISGAEHARRREKQRKASCVSLLNDCVSKRFYEVVKAPSAWITKQCHACEQIDKNFDAERHLSHTCPSCKVRWDQDVNACINLLGHYRERRRAG